MCGGVSYIYQGQQQKVYFPNPYAKLPVLKKGGEIALLAWGRRQDQEGHLPLGGWARLESIKDKRWDKYFPRPVKIAVDSFMEKDMEGESHWFTVMAGQYIQGLLATYQQEQRLYVVTVLPEQTQAVHDRWPRIILGKSVG